MSGSENQFIRIGNEYVFLVLTEQRGSDFTFYLRNDDELKLVRRILQEESSMPGVLDDVGAAKAGQPAGSTGTLTQTLTAGNDKSPKAKYSYSCRLRILKVLLDKKDLIAEAGGDKEFVLLKNLRAASKQ